MHPKKIKATVPGQLNAVQVIDGDISGAIRIWKKIVKDSQVVEKCYDNKFYQKPSDVKRKTVNAAKYAQLKISKS